MQLHYNPRLRPDSTVVEAMTAIAKEVDEEVELVIDRPSRNGWHGRLLYRKHIGGFRVEIEDPAYLFESKKRFTRAAAARRMLRHIEAHHAEIRDTIIGFTQRVREALALEKDQETTQQEA